MVTVCSRGHEVPSLDVAPSRVVDVVEARFQKRDRKPLCRCGPKPAPPITGGA